MAEGQAPVFLHHRGRAEGRSQAGCGMAVRRDGGFARAASGSCESRVARGDVSRISYLATRCGWRSQATGRSRWAVQRGAWKGRRGEAGENVARRLSLVAEPGTGGLRIAQWCAVHTLRRFTHPVGAGRRR